MMSRLSSNQLNKSKSKKESKGDVRIVQVKVVIDSSEFGKE
jgi:hypothetical protein